MSEATFTHSESLTELGPALLAVQQAVEQPVKSSENTFHRSKYADLASCWAACRVLCGKHGLMITQVPCYSGDRMVLVTMLWHTSGEWLQWETPLRPKRTVGEAKPGKSLTEDDPQVFVAGVTYLRRCVMGGIFALTPEDDDGNTAAGVASQGSAPARPGRDKQRKPAPQKPAATKPATGAAANSPPPFTREAIGAMIMRMVGSDKAKAAELYGQLTGRDSSKELPSDAVESVYRTVRSHFVGWEAKQEPKQ